MCARGGWEGESEPHTLAGQSAHAHRADSHSHRSGLTLTQGSFSHSHRAESHTHTGQNHTHRSDLTFTQGVVITLKLVPNISHGN